MGAMAGWWSCPPSAYKTCWLLQLLGEVYFWWSSEIPSTSAQDKPPGSVPSTLELPMAAVSVDVTGSLACILLKKNAS